MTFSPSFRLNPRIKKSGVSQYFEISHRLIPKNTTKNYPQEETQQLGFQNFKLKFTHKDFEEPRKNHGKWGNRIKVRF